MSINKKDFISKIKQGVKTTVKYSPAGVVTAAAGLVKDKKAQKKSEKGLADMNAKAAKQLGKVNKKSVKDKKTNKKFYMPEGLKKEIKNSNLHKDTKTYMNENDKMFRNKNEGK